jgi:hypothetical protein
LGERVTVHQWERKRKREECVREALTRACSTGNKGKRRKRRKRI